jgi:hypothetical protein
MSQPGGKNPLCSLKTSRMIRFDRFLMTAPPTFLLAVIPSLVRPSPFLAMRTVKWAVRNLRPNRFRLTKSLRSNTLSIFGKAKAGIPELWSFQKVKALSYRQTFSAFGSSSFKDLDTPGSTHSCPESMSPRPSDIAWLIRSFHGVIVSVF